jgi:hypothetical protein
LFWLLVPLGLGNGETLNSLSLAALMVAATLRAEIMAAVWALIWCIVGVMGPLVLEEADPEELV